MKTNFAQATTPKWKRSLQIILCKIRLGLVFLKKTYPELFEISEGELPGKLDQYKNFFGKIHQKDEYVMRDFENKLKEKWESVYM